MKSFLFALCLFLGGSVFISFSEGQENHDRFGNFYVNLVNSDGELKTKQIQGVGQLEWQDSIQSIYFQRAKTKLEVEGMVVFAPKIGDALVYNFKSTEQLGAHFRALQKKNFNFVQGDRIIFDNLRNLSDSSKIDPIYFTIGY